jgi:hypothetical protein
MLKVQNVLEGDSVFYIRRAIGPNQLSLLKKKASLIPRQQLQQRYVIETAEDLLREKYYIV